METIFKGSYKTIEEYYAVIFQELCGLKSYLFLTNMLHIGIYTLYTLSNQLYNVV